MGNLFEVARLGEWRRSVEQSAVFESPDQGYTAGSVTGLNRTLARTGLGVWEIVTFPLPNHSDTANNYGPICTSYLTPNPPYPASYKPGLMSGSTFDTDTYTGFSGGDVAPFVPGSRFKIFEN